MRALGSDLPVVQHEDLVRVKHRADALGDHKRRAIAHQRVQCILDLDLGLHIDRTGAVIQDQHCRLRQQRASNGHALLLSPRQVDAALTDHRIIALFKPGDKVVRLRRFGRSDHLFVTSVRTPIADVVADGPGEQDRLLQRHANIDGAALPCPHRARPRRRSSPGPRSRRKNAG